MSRAVCEGLENQCKLDEMEDKLLHLYKNVFSETLACVQGSDPMSALDVLGRYEKLRSEFNKHASASTDNPPPLNYRMLAPRWQKLCCWAKLDRETIMRIAQFCKEQDAKTVVEVGAGAGLFAALLKTVLGPTVNVIATDAFPEDTVEAYGTSRDRSFTKVLPATSGNAVYDYSHKKTVVVCIYPPFDTAAAAEALNAAWKHQASFVYIGHQDTSGEMANPTFFQLLWSMWSVSDTLLSRWEHWSDRYEHLYLATPKSPEVVKRDEVLSIAEWKRTWTPSYKSLLQPDGSIGMVKCTFSSAHPMYSEREVITPLVAGDEPVTTDYESAFVRFMVPPGHSLVIDKFQELAKKSREQVVFYTTIDPLEEVPPRAAPAQYADWKYTRRTHTFEKIHQMRAWGRPVIDYNRYWVLVGSRASCNRP
jgi:hypothetical protein